MNREHVSRTAVPVLWLSLVVANCSSTKVRTSALGKNDPLSRAQHNGSLPASTEDSEEPYQP